MVTVGLTNSTTVPTVTSATVYTVGTTQSGTSWKDVGTPISVPAGAKAYFYFKHKGTSLGYVQLYDTTASSQLYYTYTGNSWQNRTFIWTNTDTVAHDVKMQIKSNGSSYTAYGDWKSYFILSASEIDQWEEINLASLGSTASNMTRNWKMFIDKYYVTKPINAGNCAIDGISAPLGSIKEIDVGTLVTSTGFAWSYTSPNYLLIATTGKKFTVSS